MPTNPKPVRMWAAFEAHTGDIILDTIADTEYKAKAMCEFVRGFSSHLCIIKPITITVTPEVGDE